MDSGEIVWHKSIAARLLVLALVSSFLPIGLLSWISITKSREALHLEGRRQSIQRLEYLAGDLATRDRAVGKTAKFLVKSKIVQEILNIHFSQKFVPLQLKKQVRKFQTDSSYITRIRILDTNDKVIVDTRGKIQTLSWEEKSVLGNFPQSDAVDQYHVLKNRDIHEAFMRIVPIYGAQDGTVLGTLLLDVDLTQFFSEFIKKTGGNFEWEFTFAIDDKGVILNHTDSSIVMSSARASMNVNFVDELMAKNEMEWKLYSFYGAEYYVSGKTLPTFGWTIGRAIPKNEFEQSINELPQLIVTAALIILIFVAIFSYLFSRKITRPLKTLTKFVSGTHHAEKQQHGSENDSNWAKLLDQSSTEWGQLAQSFDQMTDRVDEARESLEAKVSARTRELVVARDDAEIAAQELERHRNDLERTVDERTRDLRVAKDQAEYANASKSEFLANITHELRTPLHGILNWTALSVKKMESGKLEKIPGYLERIGRSGRNLNGLVDNLLNLAKLESGKMEFDMAPDKMAVVVRQVIGEFDSYTIDKNIHIEWIDSPGDDECIVDSKKISQVIRNLISNSIKFSLDAGCVWISRSVTDRAVTVSVRDNGVGIPEEELKSVFDKFVQSSKTKSGSGGTGLGLAICKQIIEGHRGRIWAENVPDGGALFCFEIPKNSLQPRILIVDDEVDVATTIREQLEEEFDCITCNDGRLVTDILMYGDFDVVLMDIMMPGINGVDVLKNARQLGINTPTIFMTGYMGKNISKADCMEIEGVFDVLEKPFRIETLNGIVKECLGIAEPL